MGNLREQSFKEIELKESKTSSGWRVMNSQEKPMKIKIVYVQAIKIERANVKIHINYCYNSNLYALFTCFVFAHHRHRCRCRRPIIIIIPLQWTPKPVLIHCSTCVYFTERFVYAVIISDSQFFFVATFSVCFSIFCRYFFRCSLALLSFLFV